ncbi:hypothetical protein A2U01_0053899, partial [Trifolium medium]|nr:hypothetical protein [Trifolium medium]
MEGIGLRCAIEEGKSPNRKIEGLTGWCKLNDIIRENHSLQQVFNFIKMTDPILWNIHATISILIGLLQVVTATAVGFVLMIDGNQGCPTAS